MMDQVGTTRLKRGEKCPSVVMISKGIHSNVRVGSLPKDVLQRG
jgi:hypothetical protein